MEEIKKHLQAASVARKSNKNEEAKHHYNLILQDDPENAIANFFIAYYAISEGDVNELYNNYMNFSDVIQLAIIASNALDMSNFEKEELVGDMASIINQLPMLVYRKLDRIARTKEDRDNLENANRASINHFYFVGDSIENEYTPDNLITQNIAVKMWKAGIDLQRQWVGVPYDKNSPREYADKIQKYDSTYILPKENFLRKIIAYIILFLSKNQK